MKDNRGLSLVEIITVVALMAVLVAASVVGIGMVSGKPVDQCGSTLKMALTSNRLSSMGKNTSSVTIRKDSSGIVYVDEELDGNVSTTRACTKEVIVRVHYNDGTDTFLLAGDSLPPISFNRSTGDFKPGYGDNIDYIEISKNHSSKVRRLVFYSLTGKVTLE